MVEKEELKHDFFQIIPSSALFFILQYSEIKMIASLVQCSHFFRDNYFLTQRLEQAKISHLAYGELKLAFDVQVQRTFSLSADFSNLDTEKQEIVLEKFPCLDADNTSPLILDQSRANSYFPGQKYDISIFKDLYHREALMLEKTHFCLVSLSCVFNTRYESTKVVVFDSSLLALVRSYLWQRGLDPDYSITNSRITFLKDNEVSHPMISVLGSDVNQFLHELGTLGALPSRDWQLKTYNAKNFTDLNLMRRWYLKVIKPLTGFFPNEVASTPLLLTFNFNGKKTEILEFLYDLSRNFSSDVEQEQRHFYCKVIINLLETLNINEAELDRQQQIQALLSLQRLETLLEHIKSYTYTNFLRTLEASK